MVEQVQESLHDEPEITPFHLNLELNLEDLEHSQIEQTETSTRKNGFR